VRELLCELKYYELLEEYTLYHKISWLLAFNNGIIEKPSLWCLDFEKKYAEISFDCSLCSAVDF
jgi:hypothetical protein